MRLHLPIALAAVLAAAPARAATITSSGLSSGSNNYIQNTSTYQAGAQFNISSGVVQGQLQSPVFIEPNQQVLFATGPISGYSQNTDLLSITPTTLYFAAAAGNQANLLVSSGWDTGSADIYDDGSIAHFIGYNRGAYYGSDNELYFDSGVNDYAQLYGGPDGYPLSISGSGSKAAGQWATLYLSSGVFIATGAFVAATPSSTTTYSAEGITFQDGSFQDTAAGGSSCSSCAYVASTQTFTGGNTFSNEIISGATPPLNNAMALVGVQVLSSSATSISFEGLNFSTSVGHASYEIISYGLDGSTTSGVQYTLNISTIPGGATFDSTLSHYADVNSLNATTNENRICGRTSNFNVGTGYLFDFRIVGGVFPTAQGICSWNLSTSAGSQVSYPGMVQYLTENAPVYGIQLGCLNGNFCYGPSSVFYLYQGQ